MALRDSGDILELKKIQEQYKKLYNGLIACPMCPLLSEVLKIKIIIL